VLPPLPAALRSRMNVIDHVRDMAAAGLHSNVRLLSSLLLTMSNNNPVFHLKLK
ncbi:ANAPC7 isoform 4, partial [Pan troglodytes]